MRKLQTHGAGKGKDMPRSRRLEKAALSKSGEKPVWLEERVSRGRREKWVDHKPEPDTSG